jgi:hypothetical protein
MGVNIFIFCCFSFSFFFSDIKMSSVDPQIWRRVTSFLLAAEVAALQNTCNTLLHRPMAYFFENLKSMATVVQLHIARRMQSATVEDATSLTSGDLITAILLGQQIPVQIQQISITHFGSFELGVFLHSTCAKNVTLYADQFSRKNETVVLHLLQFSHVGRMFVRDHVLLSLKHQNVDDSRLRLRKLQIFDALRDENVPFLLSRLDDDACFAVQFLSSRLSVVTTAQQIIDFCTAVVSRFSSQPRRLAFEIMATVDATDENHHAAMDAMDEMMGLLSHTGSVVFRDERNMVVRKWE